MKAARSDPGNTKVQPCAGPWWAAPEGSAIGRVWYRDLDGFRQSYVRWRLAGGTPTHVLRCGRPPRDEFRGNEPVSDDIAESHGNHQHRAFQSRRTGSRNIQPTAPR